MVFQFTIFFFVVLAIISISNNFVLTKCDHGAICLKDMAVFYIFNRSQDYALKITGMVVCLEAADQ